MSLIQRFVKKPELVAVVLTKDLYDAGILIYNFIKMGSAPSIDWFEFALKLIIVWYMYQLMVEFKRFKEEQSILKMDTDKQRVETTQMFERIKADAYNQRFDMTQKFEDTKTEIKKQQKEVSHVFYAMSIALHTRMHKDLALKGSQVHEFSGRMVEEYIAAWQALARTDETLTGLDKKRIMANLYPSDIHDVAMEKMQSVNIV